MRGGGQLKRYQRQKTHKTSVTKCVNSQHSTSAAINNNPTDSHSLTKPSDSYRSSDDSDNNSDVCCMCNRFYPAELKYCISLWQLGPPEVLLPSQSHQARGQWKSRLQWMWVGGCSFFYSSNLKNTSWPVAYVLKWNCKETFRKKIILRPTFAQCCTLPCDRRKLWRHYRGTPKWWYRHSIDNSR